MKKTIFNKSRLIIILLTLTANVLNAVNHKTINPDSTEIEFPQKIKMTKFAFGGAGVLFTPINKQLGVLTGGRGSATFNNRYTFGGGGWGMPKGVEIENKSDTLIFLKFGYGGFEFGYVFYEKQKIRIGTNLLIGCGVSFNETLPMSKKEIKIFSVVEPSIYSQIAMGKLLKLDIGLTYRFAPKSKFSSIKNIQLRGPAIYIAFLVGTCNCN